MGYDLSKKSCGTCIYWTGNRTFGAFNTVDYNINEKAECIEPSVAKILGGYAAMQCCSSWKGINN